ncbi:MAG TPA: YggS family pyridoxal phosphate-dependent enzyme [Thermoanaerobacterales bacterium]|nr:YggS family pyridoxal phosphate-dependent enzyme [Thermoanaerobacterales bacterium]
MDTFEQNLKQTKQKIHLAATKSGRNPDDIKLVAVTKNVPPQKIQEAVDKGINLLGENRVQEAATKVNIISGCVNWHLIGHLQTNKVKHAIEMFSMIQSLDSMKLALEIDRRAKKINKYVDVLVQINIGRETSKYGIDPDETEDFIKKVANCKNIRVQGLMAIAPFKENPEDVRPYFSMMYGIFSKIKKNDIPNVEMKYLSMGMTHDFQVAIEEGSNMVRIGTGLFGQRSKI